MARIAISPEQALAEYLGLGAERSIARLHQRYTSIVPKPPHLQTLKNWSAKFDWRARAAAHDAAVGERLAGKVETAQVKADWDLVKMLQGAIDIALDAATLKGAARAAVEKGDFAGMLKAAIDAAKMREVLTGGVSDRNETKQDLTITDERTPDFAAHLAEHRPAEDQDSSAPVVH